MTRAFFGAGGPSQAARPSCRLPPEGTLGFFSNTGHNDVDVEAGMTFQQPWVSGSCLHSMTLATSTPISKRCRASPQADKNKYAPPPFRCSRETVLSRWWTTGTKMWAVWA